MYNIIKNEEYRRSLDEKRNALFKSIRRTPAGSDQKDHLGQHPILKVASQVPKGSLETGQLVSDAHWVSIFIMKLKIQCKAGEVGFASHLSLLSTASQELQ